jgi:hypothetical protein
MKKLSLLVIALCCSFITQAQSTLTGCMGINFLSSYAEVKAEMAKKTDFEVYKDDPVTGTLSYTEGSFAGRKAVGALFNFYEDKLHTMSVIIEVVQKPQVTEIYYDIIQELESKYEIKMDQYHNFKYPYKEGDGHTETALKLGYAKMESYYIFPDGNALSVKITSALSVLLEYQHTAQAKKGIDAKNAKRSTDY